MAVGEYSPAATVLYVTMWSTRGHMRIGVFGLDIV